MIITITYDMNYETIRIIYDIVGLRINILLSEIHLLRTYVSFIVH